MAKKNNLLTIPQQDNLLQILQTRFEKNRNRHPNIDWKKVEIKLRATPDKLFSLNEMEKTGGEPDLICQNSSYTNLMFMDCAKESPSGRRSFCFDQAAWNERKEFKPSNNVMSLATEMGVELLSEEQYRLLQQFGPFDTKTSSWIQTPEPIRKLGGALFADFRYGQVFVYHNGASSYYAARGFRACLNL
jgi:hypothetical protein